MVGKTLSHYKILEELGRGGMGIVYKAEDTKLDRTVAIKVLPSAALTNEEDRARFYREAKAAGALTHPHIAIVYGVDEAVPEGASEEDKRPYIAMEYIDGETLEDLIDKAPMKLVEAVRITKEIASALQLAHENEIVHRDIKSANVMVSRKGAAKVLDFGLAQTAASTKLTRLGSTLGTVSFMSPEQARGEQVDHRTDLFSLGVMLYHMISGQLPFGAEYEQAVVYSIINEEPEPLTALRTGVPMELERIVDKCLAKDVRRRYQHADDLIADLESIDENSLKQGSGSRTAIVGGSRELPDSSGQKNWLLPVAFIATAVLASLATWAVTRGNSDVDLLRVTSRNRVSIEATVEMHPSIHPDGGRIVYAAGLSTDMRLYYRSIEGGIPTKLVENSEQDQNYPSYSPDGNLVLFGSLGSIFTVEALGGVPRPFIRPRKSSDVYSFPTWSPDGDAIAYTSNSDSVHFHKRGATLPYLSVASDRSHSLAWSPDGKYLAIVKLNTGHARRGNNYAPSSIWLLDTATGKEQRITTDEFMDLSPKWAPDASGLFFVSNQGGGLDLYRQSISEMGEAVGDPLRLTIGSNLHSIDLSRDGSRLVVSELGYRQNIWASELDSGGIVSVKDAVQITSGDQVVEGIAISPDGMRIAYDSNARGLAHMFVMSLEGGSPFQISSRDEPDFLYDWSPYSDELSFHTFSEGSRDVGIVSEDGLTMNMVSVTTENELWPFWLGDENTMAYHVFTDVENVYQLVQKRRDAGGNWGNPEVIIENIYLGATWSAVRNQVAYFSGGDLYLWDPETGESQVIAADDITNVFGIGSVDTAPFAIWSKDGSRIYFLSVDNSGNQSFWAVRPDGGSPYKVVDLSGARTGISPPAVDDHRIYYTISEIESDIWVLDLAQ